MTGQENQAYFRDCRLLVCEDHIRHNAQLIQSMTRSQVIGVVKENGYGIGLQSLLRILIEEGIDFFAVSNTREAFFVRTLGWQGNLLLLSPELSVDNCVRLLEQNVIFMLGLPEQVDVLQQAAVQCGIIPRVHLKIDTGLGRYGFTNKQAADLPALTQPFAVEGCYTHFSAQGRHLEKKVNVQLARFQDALQTLQLQGLDPGMTHAASSRIFCAMGDLGLGAIRVGSLFLGRGDFYHRGFRDAICLEGELFHVAQRCKGDTLGYANGETLKEDTHIGLVRVGHGDGVLLRYQDANDPYLDLARHLMKRDGIFVTVRGKRCPVVGQSGISHMLVDLGEDGGTTGDKVYFPINPLMVHPAVERVLLSLADYPQ